MENKQGYAILSPEDARDLRIGACMEVAGAEIPDEYAVWQPPVENQGSVGNCVAQSLANIMECIDHEYGKEHEDYSVGYIYGSQDGRGMMVRAACDALLKDGDVYRSIWECLKENPACHNERMAVVDKLSGMAKRPLKYIRMSTKEEVQRFMLKYNLPVLIAGDVRNLGNPLGTGSHAVVCFGWVDPKKDGFVSWQGQDMRYQNSWGTGGAYGDGQSVVRFDDIREIWGIVPMEKKELTDIKGHWAEKYINELVDAGIVDGYEDNTFKPENYIARGENAKLIALLLNRIEVLESKVNALGGK